MFWVLSLVCELVAVAALWKIYLQNWFMLTTALIYIGLNGALVTLMVVYKKKIQQQDIIESIVQMDTQSSSQEPLVKKSNCWLQVRFQEKAILIEDNNYFKLRV